jgi:transcriptional regulator with XRE-family HTH domain
MGMYRLKGTLRNEEKFMAVQNAMRRVIHEQRMELDLSYSEIARRAGLSKSTVYRYEHGGIRSIPLDKIFCLADALGTSIEHLLGLDSN